MFTKDPWFCPAHGIVFITSGNLEVITGEGKKVIAKKGDTLFYKRYQVLSYRKKIGEAPYSEIAIAFTESFLQEFFNKKNVYTKDDHCDNLIILDDHPIYKTISESLVTFFENEALVTPELLDLKTKEALLILLQEKPELAGTLADFPQPGKIDLQEFMNKNFVFNNSVNHFAQLTGRSLASFKRDFQKVFDTSPQKWMIKKRLEMAHLLIKEMRQTPVDIYLDMGFESLSHFSTAFKREFGYNPSSLLAAQKLI
jgi:AraC-like DNA-binding protein